MSTCTCYTAQRDEMQAQITTQAPAELLKGFATSTQRLDALDFAARAPKVGDDAPDFALPDQRRGGLPLIAAPRRSGRPDLLPRRVVSVLQPAAADF